MTHSPMKWCVALLAIQLTGCSLMSGGPKASLYRFGSLPPAEASLPTEPGPVVAFAGSSFAPAIRGDRLLTVNGTKAAYIAGARWLSPADQLFDAAAVAALDRLAPPIRIVGPAALPRTDYLLQIDVRHFEAVYSGDPAAAPTIMIEARVSLIRRADGSLVGERLVTLTQPASENRVAAIVAAFDAADVAAAHRIAIATEDLTHGSGR